MFSTNMPNNSGCAEGFSNPQPDLQISTQRIADGVISSTTLRVFDSYQKNTRWLSTAHNDFDPIQFSAVNLGGEVSDKNYDANPIIQDLVSFLKNAPTSWHAVHEISKRLDAHKFKRLDENAEWKLVPGESYYVVHNDSSIIAFTLPVCTPSSAVILGAHTDSPGLQVKPNPDLKVENYRLLATQVYGGPTLPSWFNRPLGLAGRYYSTNEEGKLESHFIDISEPVGNIPHLAIHLNRDLGTKVDLNPQKELNAIVGSTADIPQDKPFIDWLIESKFGKTLLPVPGYELFLRPLESPVLWGPQKQFITSPRLDNLLGCHASYIAMLNSKQPSNTGRIKIMALWDHEEVGSESTQGAASPFLSNVLARIAMKFDINQEQLNILLNQSTCISNDVAHALHPNYPEKHDPNHKPLPGKGIVIKSNPQQRYATDAATQGKFYKLLNDKKIPCHHFVVRSDSSCGTTIGPIVASGTGIPTIDIGEGVLSMHAINEQGHCADHLYMCKALQEALENL